jgi:S1-C subfamily serine protease
MLPEGTGSTLASLSNELAGIVERVGPSVVRVDDGSRLTASGLIWSADGLVLASSHGVERDEELAVEVVEGGAAAAKRLRATLVGRDPETDIALLRVEATGLPAVESAAIEDAKVGHLALALARPGEGGLHATVGIISARLETERDGQPGYILHTDAVLYPGFSGGALVGMDGRVLGMTNLLFGRGHGVAVGMPVARQVAEVLLAHGTVRRGYLGIGTQPVALPEALRTRLSLGEARAALIVHVEPGSPAEQAGLLVGDLLLAIDDEPVVDVFALRRLLRARSSGQAVKLRLLRGGELREVAAILGGV